MYKTMLHGPAVHALLIPCLLSVCLTPGSACPHTLMLLLPKLLLVVMMAICSFDEIVFIAALLGWVVAILLVFLLVKRKAWCLAAPESTILLQR